MLRASFYSIPPSSRDPFTKPIFLLFFFAHLYIHPPIPGTIVCNMIHRLFLLMVVLMTATTTTTIYADDRTRHHQPIHEKLSIEQGYYTRLGEPTPFGMYIKTLLFV